MEILDHFSTTNRALGNFVSFHVPPKILRCLDFLHISVKKGPLLVPKLLFFGGSISEKIIFFKHFHPEITFQVFEKNSCTESDPHFWSHPLK